MSSPAALNWSVGSGRRPPPDASDSSLQARRIGSFRQLLVAAPEFADRIAAVLDPDDVAKLPFVANVALREPLLWQFSRGDLERRAVRMQARIAIDTTPGVLEAVRAGGGLSVLPDYLVADELASGRLIQILKEWSLPSGGIHTVYPAARFRPRKVTAFVEMLIASGQRKGSIAEGTGRAS
jgi:DNA-binding transcriptional LysR family regulator